MTEFLRRGKPGMKVGLAGGGAGGVCYRGSGLQAGGGKAARPTMRRRQQASPVAAAARIPVPALARLAAAVP